MTIPMVISFAIYTIFVWCGCYLIMGHEYGWWLVAALINTVGLLFGGLVLVTELAYIIDDVWCWIKWRYKHK